MSPKPAPYPQQITTAIQRHGLDGIEHTGRLSLAMVAAAQFLGDRPAALASLTWGYDFITSRANRLADPHHRHAYLTIVPAHREIMTLVNSNTFS